MELWPSLWLVNATFPSVRPVLLVMTCESTSKPPSLKAAVCYLDPTLSPTRLANDNPTCPTARTADLTMANEWNIAGILRAVWGCFFEVAFFWQLVRFPHLPTPSSAVCVVCRGH